MVFIWMDDTVVKVATDADAEPTANALADVATETDAYSVYNAPYLTQQYTGKTVNDVYSMLVSVRNSVLLLVMVVLVFEVHKLAKNAFKRHYRG